MFTNPDEVFKNQLLATLSPEDFTRIAPKLEPVFLNLGEVIFESGDKMKYVYFPITAIISKLYEMENGAAAEIGLVGNDGVAGVAIILGSDSTIGRGVIQSAGEAYRMSAEDLKAELERGGMFQKLLLRYAFAFLTQISQTAVCNRLHSIEQQLCRWILLSHDRLETNKLVMTHNLISNMLGVRREGVTLAARKLAQKKLIKNQRGTIFILNRKGLEEIVCECYWVVSEEYNRLLGKESSPNFS